MFGRTKDSQAPAQADGAPSAAESAPAQGKGRPTPKRREAEQRHRRVIGAAAAAIPETATKAERKAIRAAQRQATALARQKARQGLMAGDESALGPRDRGPVRRWARNYVDARLNPGEMFLPAALLFIVISMVGVDFLRVAGVLLVYGLFLLLAVDSLLLRRRVNRLAVERFGADAARGAGTYAMTRALQFRMTRLPKPQVKRGAKLD